MATGHVVAGLFRRTLAASATAVLAVALLPIQPVAAASAYATTSDVATAGQIDAGHDGVLLHDTLTPPLTQAWSVNLGGGVSYPIVDNGRVFVTEVNANGSIPQLWALNQNTGATIWGPVVLSGSGWANATLDNGRIFVEDANGFLQAFDESGNRIWGTQLTGQYSFNAAPTAANGIIYTSGAGSGLSSGLLYAIRETDGSSLWTAPVLHGEFSSPVVSSTGVYVSYSCAQTYDFNPTTGALIWQHAAACSVFGGRTPVLANGKLYVRDSTVGNVILDAASGASLGTFVGSVTPAISGNRGFFKDQYALYAYDLATNTMLWSFSGDGALTSAPILVGNYLYIGSSKGNVYALDPQSGQAVWSANVGNVCCVPTPNEQDNHQPFPGLGAGYGMLFVPSGYGLVAFGGRETLYPGDANWGYQLTGQPTVPAAPFTLTINPPGGVDISSISTTGDFSQTNTCPAATLPYGSSCVIGVTFTPSGTGNRVGTLVITDNAAGSPHVIQLSGIGAPSGTSPKHLVLSPAGATVPVGGSQTYRAELLDQSNTDLGDVTGGTTFELDGISCRGASCGTIVAGSHTVTGVYQGATGTAALTVGSSTLDHLTVTPAAATVAAGASQSYLVEGFDAAGVDLGNVTTASTLSLSPDGSCNGATCSATAAGNHTVTAIASGKSAFAQLTVSAASLDHITLDPSSLTVTAGSSFGFNTAAVDQYGNVLADVSQFTALSISPDGACSGRGCLADVPGPHTVTANYQGKSTTASVTIIPNSPYRIVVTPGSATVTAGTPQMYHVEAYDGVGNDLGDVTSSTTLSVDGNAGACVGMSCSTTIPGQHRVGAIYQGLTATANLTVNAGPVAYTTITPSSMTTTAGASFGFATRAYDQYGNFLGDVSQSTALSITPDGTCSGPGCLADIPGPHTVTANYQGFVLTVPVTITPGALYRITLTPSSSTIAAGASQTYRAEGFDGVGNDLGTLTSNSSFAIAPDGSCANASCTATTAGAHTVTATSQGKTATATLMVNAGPASVLTVAPVTLTLAVGQSASLTVSARDAYGNPVNTGQATWSLSAYTPGTLGSTTGSTTTFTASPGFAGTGTITTRLGTLTAQTSVTVLPSSPTALKASSMASHKVSLTWIASAGDLTYAVYRQTAAGGWTLVKSGLTSTSFTDGGLASGATYTYRVTGWFGTLESAASNTVSVIAK